MRLGKNRRGVVFTILAALFAMVLLSIVVLYAGQWRAEGGTAVYIVRGDEMDAFLDDVTRDMGRGSSIAGKRAITYANDVVITNGTPFNNVTGGLEEMAMYGTLNGEEIPDLENQSMEDWVEKINALAVQQHFDMDLSISQIEVNVVPYNSFSFLVQIRINNLEVNDNYGYFSFNGSLPRDKNWESNNVSVVGMEDPLYSLETNGYVGRIISASPVNSSEHGNPNVTIGSIQNRTYHANPDAPCFFERLEGKLGDPYDSARHQYYINETYYALLDEGLDINKSDINIGLETFVDVGELQNYVPSEAQSQIIKANQTVVDHMYFGPYVGGEKMQGVNPTYTWFRIDLNHTSFYGINESQLY